MKSILRAAAAVICILIITVCGVLIAEKLFRHVRADMTEHKLYTLSQGTRNILSQLNQPVRLKLYYSKTAALKGPEGIRYYNNYYLFVRDLLQEYVDRSGGRLELAVVDPRRFSDDEDEALRLGIQRFPIEDDDSFFFGMSAQTELGKQAVIPFFEPTRQEFVEYDISKLISTVTRRDKKKVGVLSSIPEVCSEMSPYMMQMLQLQGKAPSGPWTIVTQLREDYEVSAVKPDTDAISEGLDFLMVVHPKELPAKTLFAIDQFVMKGGKLLVFVDPHCMADRPPEEEQRDMSGMMDYKTGSDLNALLKGWGVEMEPKTIATDRKFAIKASVQQDAAPENVLTFMQLTSESVNANEVITAKLHNLRILFGGVLASVEGAGTVVTPLLETTDQGAKWTPSTNYELFMFYPETVRKATEKSSEKSSEKLMLACRINGTFKSNFPDGLPKEKSEAEKKAEGEAASTEKSETADAPAVEAIKTSAPDAEVLVFADVDMITDNIAYSKSFFGTSVVGDNASLVMNSLDFLGGGGDLIAIRSRGAFNRPFTVVDEIEKKAEEATAAQTEAIQKRITESQEKLRKLGVPENAQDMKLLQSAAMAEREKIMEDLRESQKELRKVNASKRERIEELKAKMQTKNMVWAPSAVLAIAVVLAVARFVRARRYARRRDTE